MSSGFSPVVRLTAYSRADRAVFESWCVDQGTRRFLWKSLPDANTVAVLFERLREQSERGNDRLVRAVRSEEALAGHIELKQTEKTTPGEGELVFFVAPGSRGRGIGFAAVRRMLVECGVSGGWIRALAVCRVSNRASIRIFERLGFERGGESDAEAVWFRRALGTGT